MCVCILAMLKGICQYFWRFCACRFRTVSSSLWRWCLRDGGLFALQMVCFLKPRLCREPKELMSGHSKIAFKWSARHGYFPLNALLLKRSAGPNSSHQLLRAKQIKENYWCAAKCLMLNDKTIILSALITNIKMFFFFFWEVIVRPQCDEIQILNINSLLSLGMC